MHNGSFTLLACAEKRFWFANHQPGRTFSQPSDLSFAQPCTSYGKFCSLSLSLGSLNLITIGNYTLLMSKCEYVIPSEVKKGATCVFFLHLLFLRMGQNYGPNVIRQCLFVSNDLAQTLSPPPVLAISLFSRIHRRTRYAMTKTLVARWKERKEDKEVEVQLPTLHAVYGK